jgi:hypothetical protein
MARAETLALVVSALSLAWLMLRGLGAGAVSDRGRPDGAFGGPHEYFSEVSLCLIQSVGNSLAVGIGDNPNGRSDRRCRADVPTYDHSLGRRALQCAISLLKAKGPA